MTRLYGPALLLFIAAVWLAVLGDGIVFGVVTLGLLAAAVVLQVREHHRVWTSRRHRA